MKSILIKIANRFPWLYPLYFYSIGCIIDYSISIPYILTLLKNKSSNEIYVLTYFPIGDTVYSLAYLAAFKERHNDKQIVLLGYKNRELIYNLYERSFDRVEYVDNDRQKLAAILKRKILLKLLKVFNIYTTFPFFYRKVPFNSGETTLDVIKHDLLSLPYTTTFTLPVVSEYPITSIDDFYNIKDKIVIINPYSTSMHGINARIFEEISLFLKEQGYIVYTNAISTQEVIKHTKKLNCSILEFYEICKYIPLVISTRSGIIDFLISSSCKFYVYYFPIEHGAARWTHNPILKFYNYFRLDAWGTHNVIEHIYRNDNESLNHFIEYYNTFINNGR